MHRESTASHYRHFTPKAPIASGAVLQVIKQHRGSMNKLSGRTNRPRSRRLVTESVCVVASVVLLFLTGCLPPPANRTASNTVSVKLLEATNLATEDATHRFWTSSVVTVYGSITERSNSAVVVAGDSIALASSNGTVRTKPSTGKKFVIPFGSMSELSMRDSDGYTAFIVVAGVVVGILLIIILIGIVGYGAST